MDDCDCEFPARAGAELPDPRHLLCAMPDPHYRPEFRIADRPLCGLLGFIPYVGAFTGFLLAGTVATAQFYPEWTWILATLGVFVAGQAIEGNVLQPFLVGKAIGLHPVWLMFALFAFGYLFGFPGLLIAVPVAAAIGVLVRFMLRQYMASLTIPADSRCRPRRVRVSSHSRSHHGESFAREDFLEGPSNAAALALIEHWPDWPSRVMALTGPQGSGKSHLAAIWAAESGARFLSTRTLTLERLPSVLATGALVVEDISRRRVRRARVVSSAQSRARGECVSAVHRASRPQLDGRAARSRVAPACDAGGDIGCAGRRVAARGDRETVCGPPARGRRKPDCAILWPAWSAAFRPRVRRWSRSIARRCGKNARSIARWRPSFIATDDAR